MRFRINKTSLLKIAFSCLFIGNLFCQLPDVPAVRMVNFAKGEMKTYFLA